MYAISLILVFNKIEIKIIAELKFEKFVTKSGEPITSTFSRGGGINIMSDEYTTGMYTAGKMIIHNR